MWKQTLRQSSLLRILCQKLNVSLDIYFRIVALRGSYVGIRPYISQNWYDFLQFFFEDPEPKQPGKREKQKQEEEYKKERKKE